MKKLKASFLTKTGSKDQPTRSRAGKSTTLACSADTARDWITTARPTPAKLDSAGQTRSLACSSLPSLGRSIPPPSCERFHTLVELVSTEQSYTLALRNMLVGYKQPLTGVVTEQQLNSIFSISELIYDFHLTLVEGLRQRLGQWDDDLLIGGYLLQMVAFLRSYSVYVNNYTLAVSTLSALETDVKFAELLQSLRSQSTEEGDRLQSLYTYLVMPIQRVPRYLLLLERLKACTAVDHPDFPSIEQSIDAIAQTAIYIDERRGQYENNQRMLALSLSVHSLPDGFSVLAAQRTLQYSCEVYVEKTAKSKKIHAFLLSDGLLLAKAGGRKAKSRSYVLPGSPPKSASRAASSSSSDLLRPADDLASSQSYRYLDWLPFAQPSAVTVTNHGNGQFSLGTSEARSRVLVLRDDVDESPLLDRLCAALGRQVPPPVPPEAAIGRPRRSSISSLALSLGSLVSSAACSSSSSPAALSDVRVEKDETTLSPRLSNLMKRRGRGQRTKSDPPGTLFALRPKAAMSIAPSSPHDHGTMTAAGFVDPKALPLPHPPLSWIEVESDGNDATASFVVPLPDFRYELGGRELRPNLFLSPQFMYAELVSPVYEQHMAHRDHVVFFGNTPEKKDPVVVSLETHACSPELPFRRVVVRSKHGKTQTLIPLTIGVDDSAGYLERECCNVVVPPSPRTGPVRWIRLAPDTTPQAVFSPRDPRNRWNLVERLVDYDADQRRMYTKLKIGVVPTKPGDMAQLSDRKIFQTNQASPEFQEFLDFLGDTVPLKGYDGFAGGLDTTADMTGSHSVRTTFESCNQSFDIMFHVSTMLPHVDGDEQQLAKKRHIGNDIVVVVFHQDDQPFDPRVFISKMNQVFLVVKKVGSTAEGRPIYRLGFVCKDQAPSLPVLPPRPEFAADAAFHRFLLAKLINAEATTHQTCLTFMARNRRARASCLQEIIDTYTPPSDTH